MKRARWFLNNGYSAARTAEITGVPEDVCDKMKNGWPQDPTRQGMAHEGRQARQIIEGEIREPKDC